MGLLFFNRIEDIILAVMRHKNDLILKAFERHFQEETRLIHFGVVAPILENAFFALALFRKKEQKTMLEGKEVFLRLIAYQSKTGLFPDAIHLLDHGHFSWKKNLYLAAVFFLVCAEFDRVIDKVSKEKIHESYNLLVEGLKKLDLDGALNFLRSVLMKEEMFPQFPLSSQEEADILVVAYSLASSTLRQKIEDRLSLYVVKGCPYYQGPFEGLKQYRGYPLKSLLEIALTFQEDLKEEKTILDRTWMESVLVTDLSHLEGKAAKVRHKELSEKGDFRTRAFLDFPKGATMAFFAPQATTFDPQKSVYTIPLRGMYEEDAHEIGLFVNLDPSIQVLIKEAKSSIFNENEAVTIHTSGQKIPLKFRVVEGEGKFIGHISLDSRPYELEKGGIFDRKISIRTVERAPVCTIELFIGWNQEKCPF